jgi:hypothetical protein
VEKDGLEQVRKIPGYHDEPLKGELVPVKDPFDSAKATA